MDELNSMMPGGGSGGGGGENSGSNSSKKAVHVKWAGKTIALGTFQQSQAEEKCARAKALTRAWRSTMRPKPTREWVMLELERLGVRVVSGRVGKNGGDDDDGPGVSDDEDGSAAGYDGSCGGGGSSSKKMNNNMMMGGRDDNMMMMSGGGMSSLGMGMGMGNMMGMMPSMNMSSGNSIGPTSSNYRPSVGEGSAVSYEAARADHYRKMKVKQSGKKRDKNSGNNNMNPMNALNSTNFGMNTGMNMNTTMTGGGGMSAFGLSVNPNQHFEMLKLHHMNLLNEIQETTLMMNLYQQQQMQQQSQQGGGKMGFNMGGNQLGMLGNMGLSGGNANFMMGMNTQDGGSVGNNNTMAIPQAQNDALADNSVEEQSFSTNSSGQVVPSAGDRAAFLRKLKEDIALREKEAAELEASLWEGEPNEEESSKSNKRQKNDDPDATAV